MIPIAVFASGRGSNFDAVLRAVREKRLAAEIVALVSDQPQAAALDKARAAGICAIHVPVIPASASERALPPEERARALESRRQAHEEKILNELEKLAPRFLVMAGYMRVVTSRLIDAFRSDRGYSRIVNVHPSLLPSFPGVSAYEQAFLHGAKATGVTVHLVEREVDDGPICAQETFSIADCRTLEEVEKRGLAVEHRLYPETLSWVLPEKFTFEKIRGDRYRVCEN
jgi:phosphoribosylglycinamide formyltransferase-1